MHVCECYFFVDQVWIHGGAFLFGNGGEHIGSNFVAIGDVILVTINYRLSALGFLSTGDDRIKSKSSKNRIKTKKHTINP